MNKDYQTLNNRARRRGGGYRSWSATMAGDAACSQIILGYLPMHEFSRCNQSTHLRWAEPVKTWREAIVESCCWTAALQNCSEMLQLGAYTRPQYRPTQPLLDDFRQQAHDKTYQWWLGNTRSIFSPASVGLHAAAEAANSSALRRNVRITNLTSSNLISIDLISSEPTGWPWS